MEVGAEEIEHDESSGMDNDRVVTHQVVAILIRITWRHKVTRVFCEHRATTLKNTYITELCIVLLSKYFRLKF